MLKFKKYFLFFTVAYLFLAYTQIFAAGITGTPGTYNYKSAGVSDQIKQYLCAPTDTSRSTGSGSGFFGTTSGAAGVANAAQGDLYACINKLYKFAIVMGAVIGVFFLVIGGYIYMSSDGNQESVDKAKDILVSTVTAMVILLGGYVLLKAINPDLIQFKQIQPGSLIDLSKFSTSTDFRIPVEEGGVDTSSAPQVLSGNAQSLAQQILDLHNSQKIVLASAHASGNSDNANALQNIKDISQGKLAQRSSYKDGSQQGPGGTTAIETSVLQTIIQLQNKYGSFRVSELAGGVHSANSDHYTGKAFDLDLVNGQRVSASNSKAIEIKNACKSMGAKLALGPGDAGHSTHIHCSWTSGGASTPAVSTTCDASTTYNCSEPGTASACNTYNSAFQQYGGIIPVANGAALLKAIAYHETRCQADKVNSGISFGLMQMKVDTANYFIAKCDSTKSSIDGNYIVSNPTKAVCLSAEYLKYLSGICGADVSKILVGYASGQSYCTKQPLVCPTAVKEDLTCYKAFST